MNSKTFTTLLVAITFLCALLTVAHMLYAIDAYSRTSIIYFIAKELW